MNKASAPTRERRAATAHNEKNLLTDDRVKAMLAAVSSGNLDELRILRYRGAQIKGWSHTKVGDENVMRDIVHEGIEVPTSFIDRRNPPGKGNPEDYYGYRYDPRSGKPWAEVGDMFKLEDEAVKVSAETCCEVSYYQEARRFVRQGRGHKENIFDTDWRS